MGDSKAERRYWVRTEQGRVWGPFPLAQLDRLKSQLTEKAEASFDGKAFRPAIEFLELKSLVTAKPAAPAPAPRSAPAAAAVRKPPPSGIPTVGPALRALFGDPEKQVAPPAPEPRAPAPAPARAA